MKVFNQVEFGKRFKALREEQKFGLREFCRQHGKELTLNAEDWGDLEKGKKSLKLSQLVKFCIYFDRSPLWFLSGIKPQSLKETERLLNSATEDEEQVEEAINATNDKSSRRQNPKEAKNKIGRRTRQT